MKIDEILSSRPKDFSAFLEELKASGYEIKAGTNIAVKGSDRKDLSASLPFLMDTDRTI